MFETTTEATSAEARNPPAETAAFFPQRRPYADFTWTCTSSDSKASGLPMKLPDIGIV